METPCSDLRELLLLTKCAESEPMRLPVTNHRRTLPELFWIATALHIVYGKKYGM